MNEPVLTYRGKTNLDFDMHLDVGSDFEFGTGSPSFTSNEVAGLNKTLLDFNNYKNFDQKFTFYAIHRDVTSDEAKRRITSWLLKEPSYHKLLLSMIPDYYMIASPNSNSVLKFPAYNQRFSKVEINFSIQPFMYHLEGQNPFDIKPNNILSINNPEEYEAEPLIHIVGNSDVTLTVNNSQFKITSIDEEVYIDSENCLVYKSLDQLRNRNAIFPDHNFPILQPGSNSISITGNYSSATITPRWRTLC